jgi:hypothetical protein
MMMVIMMMVMMMMMMMMIQIMIVGDKPTLAPTVPFLKGGRSSPFLLITVAWPLSHVANRRLVLFVNAYNRDTLTDTLKKLQRDAIDVEAEKDEYFRNLKAVSPPRHQLMIGLSSHSSTSPSSSSSSSSSPS